MDIGAFIGKDWMPKVAHHPLKDKNTILNNTYKFRNYVYV